MARLLFVCLINRSHDQPPL